MSILEDYQVMKVPPPLELKAHSTKVLTATWAERAGATPNRICKAATWFSMSVCEALPL